MGGAWLTGALHALAEETGWDPGSAEVVVGTSAGSMVGALLTSGVPPWFMVAHQSGESFDGVVGADGRPAAEADRSGGAVFRLHRAVPRPGPASWALAVRAIRAPHRFTPGAVAAAWMPYGVVSTEALKDTVRRAVDGRWAPHPAFWSVACDLATGRRTVFGREDAPDAHIADAVAASCAIPAFYRPVGIGGRAYVDGGACSASNLDVLRGRGLDAVICLNPLSSRAAVPARTPQARVAAVMRANAGRRLGREARALRAEGTEVVLLQPTAEDLDIMGANLMDGRRRAEAAATAMETTRRALDGLGGVLGRLPRAPHPALVRRPADPPHAWPPFQETAALRFAA